MNDKPAETPKKKSFLSIPFIVLGVLLIAALLPILNDFDNDDKRDSISKYVMFKVMSGQEGAEAGKAGMYKHSDEIEATRDKTPRENTKAPTTGPMAPGGGGGKAKSETKKRPAADGDGENGEAKKED